MKVIDLSQSLETGMPVYPGTEAPGITVVATISEDGYLERRVNLLSHTGTHVDAPAHVVPGGVTLDGMELRTFIGPALRVNCSELAGSRIEVRHLQRGAGCLSNHSFCLLYTGWSRFWGDSRYFHDYPFLGEEAAQWLVQAGVRGVGIDAISVDPSDSAALPAHRVLLGAGLVIVENLTNLAALPDTSFLFSCLPLKIRGGDGAPARAVAIL